jgi:hypothetical protein
MTLSFLLNENVSLPVLAVMKESNNINQLAYIAHDFSACQGIFTPVRMRCFPT